MYPIIQITLTLFYVALAVSFFWVILRFVVAVEGIARHLGEIGAALRAQLPGNSGS